MAVVKTAVDLATLSEPAIEQALAHYGRRLSSSGVEDGASPAQKLHNGYSGCNYRVLTAPLPPAGGAAEALLLKGSADKPPAELAVQVELLRHLEAVGFPTAAAVPPADSAAPWVIEAPAGEGEGAEGGGGRLAVFLLRFVAGQPANLLIGSGALGEEEVLATAGATLAQLHLIAPPAGFRRYASGVGTKDGMFSAATVEALRSRLDESIAAHPFLDFFEQRIPALRELVGAAAADGGGGGEGFGMEEGLMHCNFFLDNILMLHEQPTQEEPAPAGSPPSATSGTGLLSALIDWEDAAAGPLLHDLGIGILGCCYDAQESLSPVRLVSMLKAYNSVRPLLAKERGLLRQSVLGAALAVGFFRWRQFNVRHPELVDVSYL